MWFATHLTTLIAIFQSSNALGFPQNSPTNKISRNSETDAMFDCPKIDHHFQHQRFWIAASFDSKCMTLESDAHIIHALNRLPPPSFDTYRGGYSVVCSLKKGGCEYSCSPLDKVCEHAEKCGNSSAPVQ